MRAHDDPLTPLAFLERSGAVFADHVAVIDDDRVITYGELLERSRRLAGALRSRANGSPVAVLAPNTAMLLEAHFGVPGAGVPLVPLNVRLSADELGYILSHSGATTLLADHELIELASHAVDKAEHDVEIIQVGAEYEALLASADPIELRCDDENALVAVNYTSGTTGRPKGVMYHHRGAFLQSLAMVGHMQLDVRTVYLWTLPMFHCNGWCFTWAITAAGGTHVCLRRVEPAVVWQKMRDHAVTHLCGAPTVLSMLAYDESAAPLGRTIRMATGGAPPSPAILARMAELDIDVTHLYGMTETFGPAVICEWQPAWDGEDAAGRARLQARQGVGNVVTTGIRVVDQDTGAEVASDGDTLGEVEVRGNNIMLGYFRDEAATEAAFHDGWLRTGDLGVRHPDGYVELRDRSKDIIISGGENISSIEVEQAIASHPAVLEAAVVAMPDEKWGEVPVAYVTLKPGARATDAEIIEHVRARLARFKAPKRVTFGPLPKTGTGKIQKYVLRAQARADAPTAP